MRLKTHFILASASPRRKHLLACFGIPFEVRNTDISEIPGASEPAQDLVKRLATEKARYIADSEPDALILGADTAVLLDGSIIGKPTDQTDAHRMLGLLSGRTHTVLTGMALIHDRTSRVSTAVESTDVTFDELTPFEIEKYVQTGSPMDKAGAYGIQDDRGALFVSRIDGDFYNVMGLPVRKLYRILKAEFPDLLVLDS